MRIPRSVFRKMLSGSGFLTIVVLLLSLVALWYSLHRWFDHDEFEHIHSAWYVANGYTPYTDFFQNHHPLLWYCLAPLLLVLGYSTQTVLVLRMAMFGLTMGIAFLTFLIARKVTSSTTASLLSVLLLLSMVMFLEKSIEIRPDVPQVLLGLISVYFFVSFLQTQRNLHAGLAGLCASLSFLFLQKTVFLLLGYAALLCYGMLRRRIPLRSTVCFVVSFAFPAAFFLAYLLVSASFQEYLLATWLVNTRWLEFLAPLQHLYPSFAARNPASWLLSPVLVAFVLLRRKTDCALKAGAFVGVVLLPSAALLVASLLTSGSFEDYLVPNWQAGAPGLDTSLLFENLSHSFATQNALFWLLTPVSVALILLSSRTDRALKATAFVGLVLLASVFLVKAPHRQYYMFAIPPLCVSIGYCLERAVARFRLRGIYLGLLVILLLVQPLSSLGPTSVRSALRNRQLAKVAFVIDNSSDSDLVYDGNAQFNLYRRDLHYFWYSVGRGKGLGAYNAIANNKYGDYDVCQLVRSQQPEFISDYGLELATCGLRPFYRLTPFSGLYVRSEHQGEQRLLWRDLGHSVALVGYEADSVATQGSLLHLTLWWQALAKMDTDYTLFIHVVGPDDRIWAQHDSLLLSRHRPTSAWRPGQIAAQQCDLALPNGMPRAYTMRVGLYYWETGERLPVWDERGQRVIDDAMLLLPEAEDQELQ